MRRLRIRPVVVTLLVIVAACGSDTSELPVPQEEPTNDVDSEEVPEQSELPVQGGSARDDVDCDRESLGEDDEIEFVVAHYVVDGTLGDVCYGEEDPTVFTAWDQLAIITPPGQLHDLFLFGGFVADPSGENETLAFVNVVDDDASGFQMSINLDAYDTDPDEAALTMAHEFAHVFSSNVTQLDRSVEFAEDCDTYFNAEGCFLPDSIMATWVDLFWGDALIDEIDPFDDPDPEDGENRCSIDARFLGPYAASNPEEDFAETFSAFVFQLSPVTDEVQEKIDWIANQPGLVAFRDRAEQAALGPLENNFEPCGD